MKVRGGRREVEGEVRKGERGAFRRGRKRKVEMGKEWKRRNTREERGEGKG